MTDAIKWVATLSDGTTVAENSGEYQVIPGERKPWVRLTEFLNDNNLYLTSLRLNFQGRTYHMPKSTFDRFGLNEYSRAPLFYSLQYFLEGELGFGGIETQRHFIDLCAHFSTFEVHNIHEISDGNNSWIVVTENYNPMAPTPQEK